ncbi:MAG: Holliday junction resolvase RuvX [Pirellulales bacterium]|nr:Holliday junction resolvase RuvX [Pirellulales bacterium]
MTLPPPKPGRVAGIDFGTVRIGIAVSDAGRRIASPLETYRRGGAEQDARRFRRLAAEEEITLFVVGLPVHLDGRESEQSQNARQFGRWLQETTGVPVVFFDERFTTREAEAALEAAQLTSKRRKSRRDRVAAQILLAAFLETGQTTPDPPGGLEG